MLRAQRSPGLLRTGLAAVLVVAVFFVVGAAAQTSPPLIGVTFTHAALQGCDPGSDGIVLHYDRPGMRRLVRAQLAAMHAAGIQTIRILLWNMSDITGQDWGVIPSAGGQIVEPYRSNLIRFVSDVRAAGFTQLTTHFSPQWTNSPIATYGPNGLVDDPWDPSKFDENWEFIEDAHKLIKQYGPPSTHFDILSEGPPTEGQTEFARLQNYIETMWTRYVSEFGKRDVTVTTIGDASQPDRLQNLLNALRVAGRGFPDWFEVHGPWTSPDLYSVLMSFDRTLDANGLTSQPLVVGEASYNNPATARDIARFINDSGRSVSEVYEWWRSANDGPCVSPPYRADAYITTLTGASAPPPTSVELAPIPKLVATVTKTGGVTLRVSGHAVKTLDAGRYAILVRDQSRRDGFHLVGPNFEVRTTRRFFGRKVIDHEIGLDAPYGSVFRYGTDRMVKSSFVIH